jgi:YD repeat-containing protein
MKLAVIFSLLAALAAADTVHYTYDAAGRLTRADYANGGSIAYTYDPSGNLLNRTVTTAAPQINAVTNAASFQVGPVSPCEIVTLFGLNLDRNITFDNTPATVGFFSANQANVTVSPS